MGPRSATSTTSVRSASEIGRVGSRDATRRSGPLFEGSRARSKAWFRLIAANFVARCSRRRRRSPAAVRCVCVMIFKVPEEIELQLTVSQYSIWTLGSNRSSNTRSAPWPIMGSALLLRLPAMVRRGRCRPTEYDCELVGVAKGERISATGTVDQVAGNLQSGEDFPHARDVIAHFLWIQC